MANSQDANRYRPKGALNRLRKVRSWADSGLSAHDHKAAVRHSGRNVQTLHSFSGTHFRTDFIPPINGRVAKPKPPFVLIHTPHCTRLQARLRPLLATLLRSCFDSFSIRSGRARARARVEWRGLGAGRDRGMYQINGRRKQQQGRSGHGREGAARAHEGNRAECSACDQPGWHEGCSCARIAIPGDEPRAGVRAAATDRSWRTACRRRPVGCSNGARARPRALIEPVANWIRCRPRGRACLRECRA